MVQFHVGTGPHDLEGTAERKQSLKEVLLRPKSSFLAHPVLGILQGQEDVVDMDEDARAQPWQDFQAATNSCRSSSCSFGLRSMPTIAVGRRQIAGLRRRVSGIGE
jgi:hypothetical protein